MSADLVADIVELAPWRPPEGQTFRLREVTFRADSWLPEEDAELCRRFNADEPIREIAAVIGRPLHGTRARICALGLRRNSQRPWVPEEDAEVIARYGAEPCATIAQDIGRTVLAVYIRAQLLALTETSAPDWDDWEDEQLRAGYAAGVPVGQIATLIGRTLIAARCRASFLGLRHPSQPPNWSDEECNRALELAAEGHRYLAIIEMLVDEGYPRRTKSGFGQRLRILGYGRGWGRRWTREEEDLLRQAYASGASIRRLGNRLSRTVHSMKWKGEELGLQGTHPSPNGFRQGPVWTPQEEQFLRENYGKIPTRELSAQLGRPRMGVLNRAWHLGLKHGYWRPYTPDELRAFAIAFAEGISIADLAIALDRQAMTVSKYATDKLHLHFGRRRRLKPAPTLDQILAMERRAA